MTLMTHSTFKLHPHPFDLKFLLIRLALMLGWIKCPLTFSCVTPTWVNDSWPLHQTPPGTSGSADMCSWMFCSLHVLTFWGLVLAGPLADPHPDVSDQQLFWGSDQYDFSVVLRAEQLECFWHFAHQGEKFYLNFMVRSSS